MAARHAGSLEAVNGSGEVIQSGFHTMRVLRHGWTVLLIVPLLSCTLHQKKQAVVPPAPKPAVVTPPAPEPQPLSIPQTAVVLPSPQPVNPDAIPPVQAAPAPVADKPEPVPAEHAGRHHTATAPKAEAEPEPETPAPAATTEEPPFQPILSAEEQKNIAVKIDSNKREIDELLNKAKGHPTDQSLVNRIHSFLTQVEEARRRGDYTQAGSLSERALILARELGE